MRGTTAFVITLGLLVGLGVAADALVTRRAEERARAGVSELLDAPADVTLSGWPVGLRLLAGRVPRARVVAHGVPAGAVTLERVDVRLEDVRARLGDLDARPARLRADDGTLVAELDAEAVDALVDHADAVRLADGIGEVTYGSTSVDVAATIEDGAVVLRPIGAAPSGMPPLHVDVPPLPGGAAIDQVRITGGMLRLSGRLTSLRAVEG